MSITDDPVQYLQTVRDFIRWGASRMNEAGVFFGHGTANAIDEAAALVLQGLHLPPELPDEYLQGALTPAEKRTLLALLDRRIRERKPAAYLTHRAWFMGLSFYVDERVLVPRSPLAELIEQCCTPWLDPDSIKTVLDLGTGSGCIGIACAYAFPDATVDLVDVSAAALTVAERNIREHRLTDRVQAIRSDLFGAPTLRGRRYDLIISNPPYVSLEEMRTLPEEYRHEPRQGLVAGPKGLDVVVEILRQAADFLSKDGHLIVEVGNTQYTLVETFPSVPFLWLELDRGGDGVFMLSAAQLRECRGLFEPS